LTSRPVNRSHNCAWRGGTRGGAGGRGTGGSLKLAETSSSNSAASHCGSWQIRSAKAVPQVPGQKPGQGGDHGPVSSVRPRAGDLTAQDRYLVPQHQHLHVFRRVAADKQYQPGEQSGHSEVDEAGEHECREQKPRSDGLHEFWHLTGSGRPRSRSRHARPDPHRAGQAQRPTAKARPPRKTDGPPVRAPAQARPRRRPVAGLADAAPGIVTRLFVALRRTRLHAIR
jgi:hypothetical protein